MYSSRQGAVRTSVSFLVICSACSGGQPSGLSDPPATNIRYWVRKSSSIVDLRDRLSDIPSDTVIGEVAAALDGDPDFQDVALRSKAYQILIDRGGPMTTIGRRQLQACLSEERYRGICAPALVEVPPEAQEEVIASLAQILETPDGSPASLVPVLRALAQHGPAAETAVGSVERVFQNSRLSPELRSAAARTMSRISGAAHSLPILLADPATEVNLWPLTALDTDSKEAYELDALSRKIIQTFVAKAMQSSEKRVRQTAFESLFLAFERDFVQGDASEGYSVNPELRRAIEEMAAHEPDEQLRKRAQGVVDSLQQRLENAIRRRENPEKYRPLESSPEDKP